MPQLVHHFARERHGPLPGHPPGVEVVALREVAAPAPRAGPPPPVGPKNAKRPLIFLAQRLVAWENSGKSG